MGIARRAKRLGEDANWQMTCISMDEFSFSLKESSLLPDLAHVPESELPEMFARAHSYAVYEASTAEREWVSHELQKRVQATECQFGIDMVPETDDSLGYHSLMKEGLWRDS